MLLEKAWAKYVGTYEQIWGGSGSDFFDFIGGVPSMTYGISDTTTVNKTGIKAYNYISSFLNQSFPVGTKAIDCSVGGKYGVDCGFCMAIVGTCQVV